ncbi:MAG TPA: DUF47 family protein [Candidatus Sulfotelmatobacter sp.]|nr:DUF47 family protein [Candidatus Sulfotelmatobacter sp.]HWI57691.1 DUF47 family protein [Bacillota bacterium]
MFSLQSLLHKEDRLLTLLEASARQARTSVQALTAASHAWEASVAVQDVAYSRLQDRKITEELHQEIYSTFIAALDREDIEALANALYKIPKLADKFADRLRSAPEFVRAIDFSAQLSLLDQATAVLLQLIQSLQHGLDLERVQGLNNQLQFLEGEADKHMLVLYKDLYSGTHPAVQVLVLKDLYELLEKLIDRCRDTGNLIAHIALKNT